MKTYRILAINPGSTSAKIAVYENTKEVFKANVPADPAVMATGDFGIQREYLEKVIGEVLTEHGMDPYGFDAYAGRGGGLCPSAGGIYAVNEKIKEDAVSEKYGGKHPAALGSILADAFAQKNQKPAFIVNGPGTDEYCDEARFTGFKGVYRASHVHALNQKEMALRAAGQIGKPYAECNLIVAHLGGGISITAHRKGQMIDSNDNLDGEGPMAPTRCGAMPVKPVVEMCFSGKYSKQDLLARMRSTGGLADHLGTADILEIKQMIANGNAYAEKVYHAFIYQIAKEIGAMAAALCGDVYGIVLTGGISYDEDLVAALNKQIGFLGTVIAMPGEFEMEALAAGAVRALEGKEEVLTYTGEWCFNGFAHLRGYCFN